MPTPDPSARERTARLALDVAYESCGHGEYDQDTWLAVRDAYREAVRAAYATEVRAECEWHVEDADSGTYGTSCDQEFTLIAGTPESNDFRFCAYCGGRILAALPDAARDAGVRDG